VSGSRASRPARRRADSAGLRREAARRARSTPSGDAAAGRGGSPPRRAGDPRDRDLAPHDRGPVRAFLRDEVDARRRLAGLFLPVLGIVVICALSPASDWQRYGLIGGLVVLGAVAVDAVLMGITLTRAARAEFPDEPVPGLATGWYAFLRAHRSRALRRPAPRVAPGGRDPR
jgi:Protein of unknown function (DUF3043)